MGEGKTTKEVLDRHTISKRGLIKGILFGSAFVVPMVASFSMDTMRPSLSSAWAVCYSNCN